MCKWIYNCFRRKKKKIKEKKTKLKEKQMKEQKYSENRGLVITQNVNEEQNSSNLKTENLQIVEPIQSFNGKKSEQQIQQDVRESSERESDGSPQRPQVRNEQRVWDRQSMTPSLVSDSSVTNEVFNLPERGFQTVEDVMKAFNYELNGKIGKGGFGTVYKAYKLNDNNERKVMACKQIKLGENKKRMIKRLKEEIHALERIKTQYIIKLYDHLMIDNIAYIFMEFADQKSLEEEISFGPLNNDLAKRYFVQILIGLIHLHKQGIAHRDLKPENILLVKSKKDYGLKDVRISDFGLSLKAYDPKKGFIKSGNFSGTRSYMAPEIIKLVVFKEYKHESALEFNPFKADIWALGVCLYEMLTKTLPFEFSNATKMLENQETHNWKIPENLKNTIDSEAQDLIYKLLEPDSNLRIDPFDIITHQWLKKEKNQLQNECLNLLNNK